MPELLDAKTLHLRPEKDKYRVADKMEIPDRASDMPLRGVNVDKLNAERLNQKNNQRLNYYE